MTCRIVSIGFAPLVRSAARTRIPPVLSLYRMYHLSKRYNDGHILLVSIDAVLWCTLISCKKKTPIPLVVESASCVEIG